MLGVAFVAVEGRCFSETLGDGVKREWAERKVGSLR